MGRESHCVSRRSSGLVCRELGLRWGRVGDAGCPKADQAVMGPGSPRCLWLLTLLDTLLGSLLSASVLCSEGDMVLHESHHLHMCARAPWTPLTHRCCDLTHTPPSHTLHYCPCAAAAVGRGRQRRTSACPC